MRLHCASYVHSSGREGVVVFVHTFRIWFDSVIPYVPACISRELWGRRDGLGGGGGCIMFSCYLRVMCKVLSV